MISWLASDFFSQSPVLILPIVGLIVFMVVFTVMAIRAWRLSGDEIDDLSNQPLADDSAPSAHSVAPMNPSRTLTEEANHG